MMSHFYLFSWYGLFTLQAIMATAFGFDSDCQRNPNDRLAKHAKQLFRPSTITTMTSKYSLYSVGIHWLELITAGIVGL